MPSPRPRVTDRRRVDERGRPRTPIDAGGRREVDFAAIRVPLKRAFAYAAAQIDARHPREWPRAGTMPALLRGFVETTRQLYTSTISLIADAREEQFLLGAGTVVRALLEGLGNVLALLDDASAARLFRLDDYRSMYLRQTYQKEHFRQDSDRLRAAVQRSERRLAQYAKDLGLSSAEVADPGHKLKQWPTPGRLLDRSAPPRLRGEQRRVFQELYGFWYGSLSEYSHHRLTALQMAATTANGSDEATLLTAKSMTATLAAAVALCVLAEVEHALSFPQNTHLRAAWEVVRIMDRVTERIFAIRYEALLQMRAL